MRKIQQLSENSEWLDLQLKLVKDKDFIFGNSFIKQDEKNKF